MILKSRLAATEQKLKEIKEAVKVFAKARRSDYKQSKADKDRKILLVGDAVMRRL